MKPVAKNPLFSHHGDLMICDRFDLSQLFN